MFLGQIAGIGNANDAPRRVVSQDEGRKGDRRRYRLQRSRRHVDDQPRGLAATKPLELTGNRFEMPTWHEGLARRERSERLLDKSVEMLAQERQQQSGVSVHALPPYPFQGPFRQEKGRRSPAGNGAGSPSPRPPSFRIRPRSGRSRRSARSTAAASAEHARRRATLRRQPARGWLPAWAP